MRRYRLQRRLIGQVYQSANLRKFESVIDDVLDQASLHEGITNVLRESYGEHDVSNVRCPEDQPITTGHTFDCKVDVAGQQRTVSIRILNDKPQYEVGAPH